ncbi:MAG TPA: L,D-transpeptidase [Gaiellaceae bacterium]|nr:L,D-transpeptidase [Gaiellaceae bacterium]
MRRLAIVLLALLLASCGAQRHAAVKGKTVVRCATGSFQPNATAKLSYAGVAANGAVAYAKPGGNVLARFGKVNVNNYPTVFGVVGKVVTRQCKTAWYRVQLPVRPNGKTGYVRPWRLQLAPVRARIVVDISERRLTLYRSGKKLLSSPVAVGAPATPTPTGRFYVNQRLVPSDSSGPFGPGAIGISAFSNVLTGWAQGGPVAIHGTNEPWSIGHPVSNGCVRLPNAVLARIWPLAVAGTPVIIHA